jgi:hypothetical protein
MSKRIILTASLLLALGATGVQAQPKPANPSQCFLSRDWDGWRASADSRSIYLKVGLSQVFRLDLASACETLHRPNAHLITKIRGSSWICSPLDIDLQVSEGPHTAIPCIVKGMARLTPDQVAALPKDLRP